MADDNLLDFPGGNQTPHAFMEACRRLLPGFDDVHRATICALAAEIVALQGVADAAFEREMDKLWTKHRLDVRWARMVAVDVMRQRTARAAATVKAAWVRAATHQDERCFTLQIELLGDRARSASTSGTTVM
jgi:hypothetical protein